MPAARGLPGRSRGRDAQRHADQRSAERAAHPLAALDRGPRPPGLRGVSAAVRRRARGRARAVPAPSAGSRRVPGPPRLRRAGRDRDQERGAHRGGGAPGCSALRRERIPSGGDRARARLGRDRGPEPPASVLRDLDKVAPTDTTVLLLGETGTGKDLWRAPSTALRSARRAAHPRELRRDRAGPHRKRALRAREVRSPARSSSASAASRSRTLARSSSTRSRSSRPRSRRSCSASSRTASWSASADEAAPRRRADRCGDEPRRRGGRRDGTVPSRSVLSAERLPLRVPPLREHLDDLPLLVEHFWPASAAAPKALGALSPESLSGCGSTDGPVTSGSCRTCWSARACSRTAKSWM